MSRGATVALLILMTASAGCMPKQPPGVPDRTPQRAEDGCGAELLGGYIGRDADAATMTSIAKLVEHDRIRTIRHGEAVTMDYRPDRLNVELGEDGRIARVRCG